MKLLPAFSQHRKNSPSQVVLLPKPQGSEFLSVKMKWTKSHFHPPRKRFPASKEMHLKHQRSLKNLKWQFTLHFLQHLKMQFFSRLAWAPCSLWPSRCATSCPRQSPGEPRRARTRLGRVLDEVCRRGSGSTPAQEQPTEISAVIVRGQKIR